VGDVFSANTRDASLALCIMNPPRHSWKLLAGNQPFDGMLLVTHTHTHTHMECAVEYDGLRHRWVRRWAKSRIHDEQVLLHQSHGQTVPVVLMTCCLRAARFLSSSATRDSSVDARRGRERDRHTRSSQYSASHPGSVNDTR